MRTRSPWLLRLAALALTWSVARADVEIFVAPGGADTAAGTRAQPVGSLGRAAELVRLARQREPLQPVTVWLDDGTYVLTKGVTLGAADSGDPAAPVTYRALPGARPTLRLGRLITLAQMSPVTDAATLARVDPAARGALRRIDLKALGASALPRWPDTFRGNAGLPELFQQGRPLPLSRWPNGEHGYAGIEEVLRGGDKQGDRDVGGVFRYAGDRPARWAASLAEGKLWLAGFWRVPWICESVRVGAVDAAARTIQFAHGIPLGIGSKYSSRVLPDGTRRGDGTEKWYALNLLEEIDRPGEWCADADRQTIWLWPAADAPVFLADIRESLLTLRDVSHVRIIGLQFDGGAGDAVRIEGGQDNRVAGCTIRNFSRRGVAIVDGTNHEVRSCDFAQIGLNAISLRGGDRRTLTPCGHRIVNNDITEAGRLEPTAAVILGQGDSLIGGGVGVNCVGVLMAHNRIHHCPNAGVYYSGNDNVIEFNEVFQIGLNSGDLGGFYSSGGWTSRGNVVRHNFVHHSPAANAYYLDDGDSGDRVTGNIAYRTGRGALLGGGHDNLLSGNLFVECSKGGISVDARGVARGYDMRDRRLGDDYRSVQPERSPWKERYPEMARLLTVDPRVPSGVVLEGNVFVASPLTLPGKPVERAGIQVGRNLDLPAGVVVADAAKLDFRLPADSVVRRELPDFPAIPVEQIGLQPDEYRTKMPPSSLALLAAQPATDEPGFDSAKDIEASNRRQP
jgi:hypothetical protein